MKPEAKAALNAYFAEGDSWAADRAAELRRSRRIAWWVAAGAAVIAVCEALALLFMAPLKTVVPYTLLVDRQTGYVQELKPLDAQQITADRALTQSFLVQYVIAREGFDINSVQSDYRKVALWSAGTARTRYIAAMQPSNLDSPLARLPRTTVVDVQVKSVAPLGDKAAMVRFDTLRRDAGGQPQVTGSWVSVVRYDYTGEPMSVADRMINPLGFKVSSYRRSEEVLPSPQPVTPTIAPAATGSPGSVPVPPATIQRLQSRQVPR